MSPYIDRLRNPVYTGANRCLPCTATNVAIAVVVAGALWLAVHPAAGIALAVLAGAVIWLRGYLIPGTPALTSRYLPAWLRRFVDPRQSSNGSSAIDTERELCAAGVLVAAGSGGDLVVDPAFEAAWSTRMRSMTRELSTRDALAELLGVSAERLKIREFGPALTVQIVGTRLGQWESRAAFVADVAAGEELARRHPRWERLPPRHRSEMAGALRRFLDVCPTCDGDVVVGEEVVESCCQRYEVIAATCTACDARLHEVELTDDFEAALAA